MDSRNCSMFGNVMFPSKIYYICCTPGRQIYLLRRRDIEDTFFSRSRPCNSLLSRLNFELKINLHFQKGCYGNYNISRAVTNRVRFLERPWKYPIRRQLAFVQIAIKVRCFHQHDIFLCLERI